MEKNFVAGKITHNSPQHDINNMKENFSSYVSPNTNSNNKQASKQASEQGKKGNLSSWGG